ANGLHAAGLVAVFTFLAFELLYAATRTEQSGQRPAGRGAPDTDPIRIQTVFFGVRSQPANGGLAIVNLGGEGGVLRQAMVDAGDGIALGGEIQGPCSFLAAALPATGVNPDHQR